MWYMNLLRVIYLPWQENSALKQKQNGNTDMVEGIRRGQKPQPIRDSAAGPWTVFPGKHII